MWQPASQRNSSPGLAVDADADLVAHRAGGDEQGRLLAEQLGDSLFQLANGGVFAEDVVAHLGGGHRGPHRGRGAGDGVAAKVDRQVEDGFSVRVFLVRMDIAGA